MDTAILAHARRTPDPAEMYQRIGELTRKLHDAMQQLGYDKKIEASLGAVPDARSRLSFIAKVTGDAAEKVLNMVDESQAHQGRLLAEADRMESLLKSDPVRAVARREVLNFIGQVRDNTHRTHSQLTEIMMAQDFHDLTGQTVRKVIDVAASLEHSLVMLLVEGQGGAVPAAAQAEAPLGFLNGPVPDAAGRTDIVSDQAGVDALLDSLGF